MTNLKPFNLEKALAGERVVTRDGKKVTELLGFGNASNPIVCYYAEIDLYTTHNLSGRHPDDRELDLFMAPKVTTYWANVYKNPDCNEFITGNVFHSEAEAMYNATSEYKSKKGKYIKTISFDLEDEE